MKGLVYNLSGRLYDFLDEPFEKKRYTKIRKKMLSNIKGTVLEVGCGTGRNFTHYSANVTVTAIDKSKNMLEIAKKRMEFSKAKIHLRKENITKINSLDNTYDNIVATFVLCVLPKKIEEQALNELIRVAKLEATFYFLEYVYSKNKLRKFTMIITSFIPKILYGIRFNSTSSLIQKNKFLEIVKQEFLHDDVIRLIVAKKIK